MRGRVRLADVGVTENRAGPFPRPGPKFFQPATFRRFRSGGRNTFCAARCLQIEAQCPALLRFIIRNEAAMSPIFGGNHVAGCRPPAGNLLDLDDLGAPCRRASACRSGPAMTVRQIDKPSVHSEGPLFSSPQSRCSCCDQLPVHCGWRLLRKASMPSWKIPALIAHQDQVLVLRIPSAACDAGACLVARSVKGAWPREQAAPSSSARRFEARGISSTTFVQQNRCRRLSWASIRRRGKK